MYHPNEKNIDLFKKIFISNRLIPPILNDELYRDD